MSDKARKQEDRSATLKSSRISTATIPLGGPSSNLIPQPGPYQLPNDGSMPIPAPHHIAYGMMRPMGSPLSMAVKSQALSNDLGPPIFMPALNLGVPKHTASVTITSSSSKVRNNLTQPATMAYDMSAMPLYPMSAYHTVPTASTSVRVVQQQQQHFLPSQAVIGMKPSGSPQSCMSQLISSKPAVFTTSVLTSGATAANHKASLSLKHQPLPSSSSSSTSSARSSPRVKSSPTATGVKSPVSVPSGPGLHVQQQQQQYSIAKQAIAKQPLPTGAQLKTENSTTVAALPMGYNIPTTPQQSINQMHNVQQQHYTHPSGVLPINSSSLPPSQPAAISPHTSSLSQMLLSPSSSSSSSSSLTPSTSSSSSAVSRHSRAPLAEGISTSSSSPLAASATAQSPTLQGHVGRLPGAVVTTATMTSSVQATSTASFTDTRLDRPPQPSSSAVPSQQAAATSLPTHNGSSKDRLTTAEVAQNMIITVPGLTGKRIAEMPGAVATGGNENTHRAGGGGGGGGGTMKTDQSSEGGRISPNGHVNTLASAASIGGGGQLQQQQQQPPVVKPGSSVVSAPPSSPPPSHSLPPPTNSSPRPRILRKRGPDGNWKIEGPPNVSGSPLMNKLPLSGLRQKSGDGVAPLSPGGDHTPNHLGGGATDFTASPRKKPRKQNVVGTDDQYASNVPDGLLLEGGGGGGGGGGQEPSWGAMAEDKSFPAPPSTLPPPSLNSVTTRSSKIKSDSPAKQEDGAKEVEIYYLSQLRRCPYPINGVYKLHHRVAHNHFRRHADIKHREDERTSAFDIANNRSSWERMSGWKIHSFQPQMDDVSQKESACLATMQRLQESLESLSAHSSSSSSSCEQLQPLLGEFRELTQGNIDRSTRVISEIEGTRTAMLKVLNHKQQTSDILKKYSATKSCPSVLSSLIAHNTHS